MADRIRNAQRHERLKELLTQKIEKLLMGDSKKKLSENQREFVSQEVDLLLHSGDVSEGALARVVAQLRVLASAEENQKKQSNKRAARTRSEVSSTAPSKAGNQAAGGANTSMSHNLNSSIDQHPSLSPSRKEELMRRQQEDLWAKMCAKDQEAFQLENTVQKKVARKKAEEQRLYLDQQIALRESKKKAIVEESKVYAVHEHEQLEIWKKEEEKAEERKKKRLEEERQIRDEQLALAKARKMQEAEHLKQEDVELAKKIKEEAEREQKLQEERRRKAREEVSKFQQFNAQFKDRRQIAQQKELEMDKEHQRMFLERLAKQEQEREDALLKMHERQKKQHLMASRMEASIAEKATEDEQKAVAYVQKIEAKKDEEERLKREKEAAEKVKLRQYLSLQILAKEKEREALRAELEEQKRRAKEEMEESERREAEKRAAQKEKALRHRKEVEQQIALHQARHDPVMTEAEARLNAKKLLNL